MILFINFFLIFIKVPLKFILEFNYLPIFWTNSFSGSIRSLCFPRKTRTNLHLNVRSILTQFTGFGNIIIWSPKIKSHKIKNKSHKWHVTLILKCKNSNKTIILLSKKVSEVWLEYRNSSTPTKPMLVVFTETWHMVKPRAKFYFPKFYLLLLDFILTSFKSWFAFTLKIYWKKVAFICH